MRIPQQCHKRMEAVVTRMQVPLLQTLVSLKAGLKAFKVIQIELTVVRAFEGVAEDGWCKIRQTDLPMSMSQLISFSFNQ